MCKNNREPLEVNNSAVINTVSFSPSSMAKSVGVTIMILGIATMLYFTLRYFGYCRRGGRLRERFEENFRGIQMPQFPNFYGHVGGNIQQAPPNQGAGEPRNQAANYSRGV